MIVDESIMRDDYWLPLWLLEGKSGKRWCISLCFIAWQLQLASLMGCDFTRYHFKPDPSDEEEEENEYYLSVGFFRRSTSDSMTDFEGPSCMIYQDLERSVYQNEGATNCAIVSLGFSSIALLYFILAMFGVVRHKNRESYGLAVVTIIAGLMMAWPQNVAGSTRCDVDEYTNSWIGLNQNFPQFKYFTKCKYGVQGACGLISLIMWISAGLLLLCNARYTKTPMQLAKAEELRKRNHLRLDNFDQDTYKNHKALAKEQEELNKKMMMQIRITAMSANSEMEAAQRNKETKSKEKQESAQSDRGQDIASNIEVPEGTDDKTDAIEVAPPVANVVLSDASISDESEYVVESGDGEKIGLVKSDVLQSAMDKSGDEEKAGVIKSVVFQSTIEKYDDEEKAGFAKSDVFQSTIENFDDDDSESDAIPSNSIGDDKKDVSNLPPQSAVEGSTTPDQNFFDADDISLAGSQDQSILTGVSYGDTTNVTPAEQVLKNEKNEKTLVGQGSTITLDKEIE